MSSINTTSKGQFVVQFIVAGFRFQHAFRLKKEAQDHQVLVDSQISKYKATGKLTPYLKTLIDGKKSK